MKSIDLPVVYFKAIPLLLLLLITFLGSTETLAKSAAPDAGQKSAAQGISKDSLQAKIEAINSRQGLDATPKAKLLSVYQSAQDNLSNSANYNARADDYTQAVKQAPGQTKKLQKDIEQTLLKVSKQKPEDFSRIPTEELEQRQIIEKGKISSLDEQQKKLETELILQQARPQLIREETVKAQKDIEATQKKLDAAANITGSTLETEASQIYLKTLLDMRTAELKMLGVEAISNPARVELLKAQLRLSDIQKNALAPVMTAIESLLTDRRQLEAQTMQAALSQAEQELSGKHPLIQALTRENIQYSRDLQAITVKINTYTEKRSKVDAEATELDSDFKSAEKKISLAGLSPALGKILREQRRNIATSDQFKLQSEAIQNETAVTSLEQFKIEDKLKQLSDVDAGLQEIMEQQVDHKLPAEQRMMIQAELRVLLNNQDELLNKLSVDYTTYLRTLGDFDFARQQMAGVAAKFATYLDENLLWVKSSDPINLQYIAGLFHSTQWLLSPLNWMGLIKDALAISQQNVLLISLGILSLALLLLYESRARRQLTAISANVEKIHTDSFHYTLQALVYLLILVLPVPLLDYAVGWFLSGNIHAGDFTRAIGEGLRNTAIPLLFVQFFYHLFAEDGIAHKHFQWQKRTVSLLRTQFFWIRFIVIPAVFIISSTGASRFSIHSDTIGRLALILLMLAMAVFTAQLLKPASGLLRGLIKSDPNGWLNKLRYVWYPAAIAIPLIIIGFAAAGFYLSALELQQKLIISLRLVFLTIIIHALVFRWLTLINRQLAIKNALQKRKAAALSIKNPAAGGEDPVLPLDEQLIDIPKINAQTIRLLNVFIGFSLIIGFWIIWKNILPAFSFLEQIALWQHKVIVDNQEIYQPVTLTNLMLAGLYFFITTVSVRNFPGLMELLVFRRLAIETGGRYAVNQLAKYVLLTIGFISVANELGGSWSQVQWLVAALSVGLGFGLQEIFANMVSGIILLFERPIRVGDTVTIGDVTGKVCRIQMRATTLIDADQKEHVVPNKTFITSQLVNWSLSDTITRLVIPVGIAYGSDVELAHKVMLDTVLSTPLILTEPAPSVLMAGFGDNALNFSIRVFVSVMSNRMPVTHDLYLRLEKALREHKIEIPFPQRDIHIRSVTPEFSALGKNSRS
jgi:potassium efflux system protein